MEMEGINKFLFWFFLIVLAFMPYGIIMTFALLLLHYGVPYIKSEIKDNVEKALEEIKMEHVNLILKKTHRCTNSNSFTMILVMDIYIYL